jgi:protein SCO1/2
MFRADPANPIATAPTRAVRAVVAAAATLLAVAAPAAHAQLILERDQVKELQGVELAEHLGEHVPTDTVLTDHTGRPVALSEYFSDGKPAILMLGYYECPVVCSVVLDKLLDSLNKLDYTIGDEYRLLVVSFDHRENTTQAEGKRLRFLSHYNQKSAPGVDAGLAFHTGSEGNIRRLTDAVGFKFIPLANGEWSHPAGLVILSPEGKITRYIYGYDYPTDQIKLSLLDATDGKIARSLGERLMHFCFRYDPTAGAYSLEAMALMRLGGVVTVVLLAVLIVSLLIGERVRQRMRSRSPSPSTTGDDRGSSRAGLRPAAPAGQVS